MAMPKDLTHVSLPVFYFIRLKYFSEVIKILQKLTDHAQLKTIKAWR